jgi:MFS transporter, DHA1 family, inner membrane transport protein
MAFFGNNAVNYLNLHYGIHAIALSGGGAFFMVYLLDSGVSVPAVFVSLAAILLGRFIVRPIVVGLSARFGLRRMVAAGTLMSAVQYPLLAEVHGVGPALYWLIVVSALADTVYWPTYHAYFAALGDDEHRGQQIGAREAIAGVVAVVSPLMTGWLLVTFGPRVAFGATAVVLLLAALPFLRTPDVKVAPQSPGSWRAALPGALLFAADGWIAASYAFVWQIALFLSLRESLLGFGGALAVAALVGAVGGLLLGRHIDRGYGRHAVWYAFAPLAVVVVLRALAVGNALFAVVANALGALAGCLYTPTLMTAVYTQGKHAPCTLRFHVVAEGGWDIGGASGLLVAALLSALGVPLSAGILLGLFGIAGMAAMLRRYYGGPVAAKSEASAATPP